MANSTTVQVAVKPERREHQTASSHLLLHPSTQLRGEAHGAQENKILTSNKHQIKRQDTKQSASIIIAKFLRTATTRFIDDNIDYVLYDGNDRVTDDGIDHVIYNDNDCINTASLL
uniref:Uncharacterized protein n=2 Tax=Oryza sativa subsp. japonica TaxID=39947 RepID=A0A5S6R6K7_ORYSJ|nr:Hypothetical protein [Oryza sativa Japonica Group]AAP52276.1 hypothetical protein LOC_Os10g08290 [Oryza sativa Japonica Group]